MSRASALVLGIAMGAAGLFLFQRLQELVEEENPEAVVDRVAKQLQKLEDRTNRSAS